MVWESGTFLFFVNRFSDDIELMTGSRPGLYWLVCWKYVSPLAMAGILVASLVDMAINGSGYEAWLSHLVPSEEEDSDELIHTADRQWPAWAKVLIFVLIAISVLWIPIVAVLQ